MSHVNVCDKWGPAVQARQRLTVEERVALARRHRQGESVAALAQAYGVTPRSVQRTIRAQDGATRAKADPAVPFAFRAPMSEIEAFDAVAREAGLGRRASAFRALLRMATGLVEPRGGEIDRLHEAAVVASRLGINLNQLVRSVHRGKLRLGEKDRALLGSLAREVEGLRREWSAVREQAGARRAYALRGLREAGEGQGPEREETAGG